MTKDNVDTYKESWNAFLDAYQLLQEENERLRTELNGKGISISESRDKDEPRTEEGV